MKSHILKSSSVAALVVGAGSVLFASPVLAQAAQGLETVTVTAERVTEDAQKTPIAMSVLSSQDLNKVGGPVDAALLQQTSPNIQVVDVGNGAAQFAVRGILSTLTTQVGDPAIAYNVDGVYLGRNDQAGATFFDEERVELLLGPQGTLYGRNATAGALNVISNKPVGEFHISGRAEVGNFGAVNTGGVINIPVTDTFWLRAAYQTTVHGSFYSNSPPAQFPGVPGNIPSPTSIDNLFINYGIVSQENARLHLQWKPTSDILALLTFNYQSIRGTPPASNAITPLGSVPPYTIQYNLPGVADTHEYSAALNVDWDTMLGTVHYTGAYDAQIDSRDYGQSNPASGTKYSIYRQAPQQYTQELRISKDIANELTYVAGIYWYQENIVKDLRNEPAQSFIYQNKSISKAVYGQVTYTVFDGLRLTGGLRLTEDNKGVVGGNYSYASPPTPTPNCSATNFTFCLTQGTLTQLFPDFANYKWKKLNYRVGVDYDITDQNLLYATLSTGYKAGGYIDGSPGVSGHDNLYNPENVESVEIGSKNRFFNNTLQVNVDLFHYLYRDFQVTFSDLLTRISYTYNAQKATPQGAEIQTNWQVTDSDLINFGVAYLDAHYTNFILPSVDTYGRQNYTGNKMANSPPWEINLGYEHNFDLGNGGTLTPRGYVHYQASENLDFRNLPSTRQGGYERSDISLTYREPDNRWDVALWARNIENKAVLQSAGPNAPGVAGGLGALAPPRTFGITLEARY